MKIHILILLLYIVQIFYARFYRNGKNESIGYKYNKYDQDLKELKLSYCIVTFGIILFIFMMLLYHLLNGVFVGTVVFALLLIISAIHSFFLFKEVDSNGIMREKYKFAKFITTILIVFIMVVHVFMLDF